MYVSILLDLISFYHIHDTVLKQYYSAFRKLQGEPTLYNLLVTALYTPISTLPLKSRVHCLPNNFYLRYLNIKIGSKSHSDII